MRKITNSGEDDFCGYCGEIYESNWIICPYCANSTHFEFDELIDKHEKQSLRETMEYHFHESLRGLKTNLNETFRTSKKNFSEILQDFHDQIPWYIPEDLKKHLTKSDINVLQNFGDGFYPAKSIEKYTLEKLSEIDAEKLMDLCVYQNMHDFESNGSDCLFYFENKSTVEIRVIYRLNAFGLKRKGNSIISDIKMMDIFDIKISKTNRVNGKDLDYRRFYANQETWDIVEKLAMILRNELSYFHNIFLEVQDLKMRTENFLFQEFKNIEEIEPKLKAEIVKLRENKFHSDYDLEKHEPIYITINDIMDLFLELRENRIYHEEAILIEYMKNREYYDTTLKVEFESH